ncbi:MAG: hypothetical protein M3O89_11465 [Actinomycetota bacterium]|nr:hypothetical protein [Actinomycetota bacterium]
MNGSMQAFKFLANGRGLFSDFAWPLPEHGNPGPWVATEAPPEACVRGIHVCREDDLPYWIDDELWLVEIRGQIVEHETMMVAEEGRLLEKVESWDAAAAKRFAEDCALRARSAAAESLRNVGRSADATALEATADLDAIREAAQTIVRDGAVDETTVVAFAADAAALAKGARPEARHVEASSFGAPSNGAIAANLAYVTAHVAGCTGGVPESAGYQAKVDRERQWQLEWFRDLTRKHTSAPS